MPPPGVAGTLTTDATGRRPTILIRAYPQGLPSGIDGALASGEELAVEFGLTGKVVLVTGASDGLGAALGRTLAAEGAHVAFCGRYQYRITAVADAVTAAGGD